MRANRGSKFAAVLLLFLAACSGEPVGGGDTGSPEISFLMDVRVGDRGSPEEEVGVDCCGVVDARAQDFSADTMVADTGPILDLSEGGDWEGVGDGGTADVVDVIPPDLGNPDGESTDEMSEPDEVFEPDEVSEPADFDDDGLPNEEDNCPWDSNPGQGDFDGDGMGDECDDDDDNDGVPDVSDEAPLDDEWPGPAMAGLIYAHTSSTLYAWNPESGDLIMVGPFGWPADGGGHQMTDIAIDYDGLLFGVTFDRVYRCSAINAECIVLATLPSSFNGLTVVPAGSVDPEKESLIGIGNNGSWNLVEPQGNLATITTLGSYGSGYTSSGDAYSVEGQGTFAAVNSNSFFGGDVLVKVDASNGQVLGEVGELAGYANVYGLAGDGYNSYAFDSSGAILELDIDTGTVEVVLSASQGESWWGAGVTTRAQGTE